MKILLADDERMVRLGLISMLDELYPGEHQYREAKNGREMLQAAEEFQPDIAFVDIQMPLMSGLEALEGCKECSPATQYLILSGYSDFEYARDALRLGTLDYLLKPVSLETLGQAVEHAAQKLARQVQQENARFAHQVVTSFNREGALYQPAGQYGAVRLFVMRCDGTDQEQHTRDLMDALRDRLTESVGAPFLYALFLGREGELCLGLHGAFPGVRSVLSTCLSGCPVPFTCLEMRECALPDIYGQYLEARRLLRLRAMYGYGRILVQDEALEQRFLAGQRFCDYLQELQEAFVQRQEIEYKNILNRMFRDEDSAGQYDAVEKDAVKEFLRHACSIELEAGDYRGFVRQLIECADAMYWSDSKDDDEIEWACGYIQEHYMEQIGIGTLAQQLDLSPNYLSKIFHQRVGSKFIDYLTTVRVANAKRMFAENPRITVREVAEQVGYSSTRHFTKIFVRMAGCLPSEYISRQKEGIMQ